MTSALSSKMRSRAYWTFIDQAVSSAVNFATSFIALRTLPLEEYGAFLAAYLVGYGLLIAFSRALIATPFTIHWSGTSGESWRSSVAGATGAGLLFSLVSGIAVIFLGAILGGATGKALIALGFVLPGLIVQDMWRFIFFANGQPRKALVNDAVWAAVIVVPLAVALPRFDFSASLFLAVWGVSAGVASLFGILQTSILPTLRSAPKWIREHSQLGLRFGYEVAVSRGADQIVLGMLGSVAGLSALGSFGGARTLLGPVNVLMAGGDAFIIPEGKRQLEENSKILAKRLVQLSSLYILSTIVVGLGLLTLPESVASVAIGENWPSIRRYIPPIMVWVAFIGILFAYRAGLRILRAADASAKIQTIRSLVTVVGASLGLWIGGGVGCAWGLAIADGLTAILWTTSFRFALRDYRSSKSTHS